MIAVIYGRTSTEQTGISDESKSVTRQIEHARQYAARKGWIVDEAHVYTDDGISGAEFIHRPGFLRLMNVLGRRAPFDVLIMSDIDASVGRASRPRTRFSSCSTQACVCSRTSTIEK